MTTNEFSKSRSAQEAAAPGRSDENRLDWATLARHCPSADSRRPPELRSACEALKIPLPTVPVLGEGYDGWKEAILWRFARQRFEELIAAIPDRLEDCPRFGSLSVSPITPLVDFFTQGFRFRAAVDCGMEKWGLASLSRPFGTLDPHQALECLYDQLRTKRFVTAIRAHLADLREEVQERPLRVVDAGCGPIPVLAMAAALYSADVQVVALETDPTSAEIARHVVESFGLSKQILVENENALRFRAEQPVHLLVSETMDAGLTRENFVEIMEALTPQLHPSARVIPERVQLSFGYAHEDFDGHHVLGYKGLMHFPAMPVITDIPFVPLFTWAPGASSKEVIRVPLEVSKSGFGEDGRSRVYLNTRVSLYRERDGKEGISLEPSEAVITRPYQLTSHAQVIGNLRERFLEKIEPGRKLKAFLYYLPGHGSGRQLACPDLELRRTNPGGPTD